MKTPQILRTGSALIFSLLISGSAFSSPFLVNSIVDAGDVNPGDGICADSLGACTLRAAIQESNTLPSAVIDVPAGLYALTIPGIEENAAATGDLDLIGSITINGAGADIDCGPGSTCIDGGGLDRVFDVVGQLLVTLNDMTIRNGDATASAFASGGGVALSTNFGATSINRCVLTQNTALNGGAIGTNHNPTLLLDLNDSTVAANTAVDGGGIFMRGYGFLTNVTVSGNTASGSGGGIMVSQTNPLQLNNATITGNAASLGGGLVSHSNDINMRNTIIAGNIAPAGFAPDCTVTVTGTIHSLGYNLIGDDSQCGPNEFAPENGDQVGTSLSPIAAGQIFAVDALGAPLLADNGGPTPTVALIAGSPAIDAGNPTACAGFVGLVDDVILPTDQRGQARIGACDVGAFEYVPPAPPLPNDEPETPEDTSEDAPENAAPVDGPAESPVEEIPAEAPASAPVTAAGGCSLVL